MKNPLMIFLPSQKTVVGIILLNLIVLSGVSISIPIIDMTNISYQTDDDAFPRVGTFVKYNDKVFWISLYEDKNPDFDFNRYNSTLDYYLNIYFNEKLYKIPFLYIDYTNVTESYNNFHSYYTKIISIDATSVLILYTNVFRKFDNDYIRQNQNITTRTTIFRINYNPLLNLKKLDYSTMNIQVINLKTIGNYTIISLTTSEAYPNYLFGVLRNKRYYTDFTDYYNESNPSSIDYYFMSSRLLNKINDIFSSDNSTKYYDPIHLEFNKNEQVVEFETAPEINLQDVLIDEYNPNISSNNGSSPEFLENIGLQSILLERSQLKLIDKYGTLHFIGVSPKIYDYEGNSTGLNNPEYLAINPKLGISQAWDITPAYNTFLNPSEVRILPLEDGEIVILSDTARIKGFYENEIFRPPYDPNNYDKDYLSLWYRNGSIQVVRIDPLHPTLENYIQWDKNVSQTPEHTIQFPRPTIISEVPKTNNVKYYNIASIILNNTLFVSIAQLDFGDHIDDAIKTETGTLYFSSGYSMILHKFDLKNGITYDGYQTLIKTRTDIKSAKNIDNLPRQKGWAIYDIFEIFVINNKLMFIFRGSYSTSFKTNYYNTAILTEESV